MAYPVPWGSIGKQEASYNETRTITKRRWQVGKIVVIVDDQDTSEVNGGSNRDKTFLSLFPSLLWYFAGCSGRSINTLQ